MTFSRRTLLASTAALPVLGLSRSGWAADPITVGVSGPLTGPNAEYGAEWKRGFDLVLDAVNAAGGIGGRPLAYQFEDSQSDPRQAVAVAQKFVSDPAIVAELGDLSSTASMAASPIYQRNGLVQFGFTNSHPDFTKGGDHMWSIATTQADDQPDLAQLAVSELGFKKLAVLHLATDWGRVSKDAFVEAAKKLGAEIVAVEGYLPSEQDFRSTLVRVRQANPDAVALESYYSDAALIARQMRDSGLAAPIVANGAIFSPKFLELGGPAVDGVYTSSNFFPGDPRPEVQQFVKSYRAKYQSDPDWFGAVSYDAMAITAAVLKQFGTTREAVETGFKQIKAAPSVLFGNVTFDPVTRRPSGAPYKHLRVTNGQFALVQPAASNKG
jgi:branched-chain amino acid transport system substrate-binding protein